MENKNFNETEGNVGSTIQKKRHTKTILQTICLMSGGIAIFMIGILVGNYQPNGNDDEKRFLNKIQTVLDLMQEQWYYHDEIENIDESLMNNALLGLTMSEEDPFTSYLNPTDTDAFFTSIDANAVGLGVSYVQTSRPMITAVYKGSGADIAGIKEGDIIIAVDGVNVSSLDDISEIQDLALGEAGTKVVVTIERDGETMNFDVTRSDFSASAYGKILDNNIGYLKINDFGTTTADDARGYLDDMVYSGVHQLIIDLRNDGGGYLTSMQDIASLFIPEGEVVLTTKSADGSTTEYKTSGQRYTQFDDFIILVDGNTASAAEAFTLAMDQLVDHVTIIGSTTYGKGSVQSSISLGDGSYLKVTTAKWFAPDGSTIDGVGINPDITIYLDEALTSLVYEYDQNQPSSVDTVSYQTSTIQKQLAFLGYTILRTDGYMDQTTYDALDQYCLDHGYDFSHGLNQNIYDALYNDVNALYAADITKDAVLMRALQEMDHA